MNQKSLDTKGMTTSKRTKERRNNDSHKAGTAQIKNIAKQKNDRVN
jgi:hypothetical protein